MRYPLYIGTAAWNIPKAFAHLFGNVDDPIYPILKRYANVFNAVEINSTFYREHQPKTFERWSQTVPEHFRFSVKLSREFTHKQKLDVSKKDLSKSLFSIQQLGDKWGALLIQLPPKLPFDAAISAKFFDNLRSQYEGHIVLEPRHVSWASPVALELLHRFYISKVCADPERCPVETNYKWEDIQYYRLHGSPIIYKSQYEKSYLNDLSKVLLKREMETWCIFDNTTFGWATENAAYLSNLCST